MMSRDVLILDRPPFCERILSECDGVHNIGWNDIPRQIVIGPMPVCLKLPKRRFHIDKRGLD
jgi:hypothetical protein